MAYSVTKTNIPEIRILEPKVFGDSRSFFFESFNQQDFNQATGLNVNFVQDNHSRSSHDVFRGLHYQRLQPQGQLVRVVSGAVFDVAVDICKSSPTFGQWVGCEMTEDNYRQFWVPPGFAHGFVELSESEDFVCKTTDYYARTHERYVAWNDQAIGIKWPQDLTPQLSAKDQAGLSLLLAEVFD
jgi:dTDP-4-dehydrorhamnose 3,5-epimerase